MSELSTKEERTEMPTERRMGEVRKKGQMFVSQDLVLFISLLTGFYCLQFVWDGLLFQMKQIMIQSYRMIGEDWQLSYRTVDNGLLALLVTVGPYVFGMMAIIAGVVSLSVMLQTNWNIKEEKIKFELPKLNPIAGFTRMFSIHGLVNTLKSFLKLAIILPIAYFALEGYAPQMLGLMHTSIEYLLSYTGDAMVSIFWQIMYVLFAVAVFDYVWGKKKWLENIKMTKDEVKDERKAIEGDEATKRQIRGKAMQRIWSRIMMSVPKADVIITNPTHYAIALKYDRATMRAPVVLAKGKGYMALRIREIAAEHNIPLVERKPLARALYDTAQIDKEIPYELYRAVAEVLAYVYRLKNPWAAQQQLQPQGA